METYPHVQPLACNEDLELWQDLRAMRARIGIRGQGYHARKATAKTESGRASAQGILSTNSNAHHIKCAGPGPVTSILSELGINTPDRLHTLTWNEEHKAPNDGARTSHDNTGTVSVLIETECMHACGVNESRQKDVETVSTPVVTISKSLPELKARLKGIREEKLRCSRLGSKGKGMVGSKDVRPSLFTCALPSTSIPLQHHILPTTTAMNVNRLATYAPMIQNRADSMFKYLVAGYMRVESESKTSQTAHSLSYYQLQPGVHNVHMPSHSIIPRDLNSNVVMTIVHHLLISNGYQNLGCALLAALCELYKRLRAIIEGAVCATDNSSSSFEVSFVGFSSRWVPASLTTHVLQDRFRINQMTGNPYGLSLTLQLSVSSPSMDCGDTPDSICIVRLPQCQNPARALRRRSSLNRLFLYVRNSFVARYLQWCVRLGIANVDNCSQSKPLGGIHLVYIGSFNHPRFNELTCNREVGKRLLRSDSGEDDGNVINKVFSQDTSAIPECSHDNQAVGYSIQCGVPHAQTSAYPMVGYCARPLKSTIIVKIRTKIEPRSEVTTKTYATQVFK
ncbi:hypothetical protein BC629DRAFT_1443229 [Irpex lacteus]|nr:hypothetical protein BC629DRAFT_1443229 [Irpex lacteus]